MDFAAQLAALDNDFDNASAMGGEHPTGRYTGQVNVCRIEEYEGTLSVKMHIKTEKGMAFHSIRLNNHPSEDSMGFAKGQLLNLGFKGRLSEVPNYLPSVIGSWTEIDVKHNAGTGKHEGTTFVNVFLRKLVPAPAGAQVGFSGPSPFDQVAQVPAAHADIPFDQTGAPVPAVAPTPAPAATFDAAPAPTSPSQAVAAATPPAAPTGLPFA